MDARLEAWFSILVHRDELHGGKATLPSTHSPCPSATDNDSTQADKARNTLPRVVNLKVNVLAPRQLTQPPWHKP